MADFNTIFKAYDVRGMYPDQIDEAAAGRIAWALASILKPKKVAVGGDVRSSTPNIKKSVIDNLLAVGIDVTDIGTITTDQLYFAVGHYGFDCGISVTASHNPGEYNGLKFTENGGRPIDSEHLEKIRDWAISEKSLPTTKSGKLETRNILEDYISSVLKSVASRNIKPLKIVANANFGAVGRSVDKLAAQLGFRIERLNWKEDGSFPKGPPNPLLPSNREETATLVKSLKPDFGVAWDADADRVFFFSSDGEFIPSCYIISLLAEKYLKRYPGSKIVHDTTVCWVIDNSIKASGGTAIVNRVGHTFIKAKMREVDAPFGGESSGHYYFRESYYADNGLIPFLMIAEMVSQSGKGLADLIAPLRANFIVSGEINFEVADSDKTLRAIEDTFAPQGKIDRLDGLSIESGVWRFNVRSSNTEPLLRLNAEAHSQSTLDNLVREIEEIIKNA